MKVRFLVTMLVVFLWAGQAYADQIIYAPTGRTLGLGQAKAEVAVSADNSTAKDYWVNVGLPKVEVDALGVENEAGDTDWGFGAQLGVLPETIITPAISLGGRDIGNNTSVGRAFYLAVTKTVPLVGYAGLPVHSIKLSGGLGTGSLQTIFGGVEIGLVHNVTGYAEWDGDHFNAAVGWSPISPVQFKAYWLDGDFFYGGRLSIGL